MLISKNKSTSDPIGKYKARPFLDQVSQNVWGISQHSLVDANTTYIQVFMCIC